MLVVCLSILPLLSGFGACFYTCQHELQTWEKFSRESACLACRTCVVAVLNLPCLVTEVMNVCLASALIHHDVDEIALSGPS